MDVVGPNQTQLVRRHVYPPQNRRTSTRCRFSVKTAWLAPYWALEADAVSQRVSALSSHLPNIIHASTPPAARFSIPLVLCIYSQLAPVPILHPPDLDVGDRDRRHRCSMSTLRKTINLSDHGFGHWGVILPCDSQFCATL